MAHCLGMSEHDPIARYISFELFPSKGRAKPPDIDIDFRHDLCDSMMTYVRDTYGHDRVANVSNYVTFRARSLLRDIGKALDFDTLDVERLRELLGRSRGKTWPKRPKGRRGACGSTLTCTNAGNPPRSEDRD